MGARCLAPGLGADVRAARLSGAVSRGIRREGPRESDLADDKGSGSRSLRIGTTRLSVAGICKLPPCLRAPELFAAGAERGGSCLRGRPRGHWGVAGTQLTPTRLRGAGPAGWGRDSALRAVGGSPCCGPLAAARSSLQEPDPAARPGLPRPQDAFSFPIPFAVTLEVPCDYLSGDREGQYPHQAGWRPGW